MGAMSEIHAELTEIMTDALRYGPDGGTIEHYVDRILAAIAPLTAPAPTTRTEPQVGDTVVMYGHCTGEYPDGLRVKLLEIDPEDDAFPYRVGFRGLEQHWCRWVRPAT